MVPSGEGVFLSEEKWLSAFCFEGAGALVRRKRELYTSSAPPSNPERLKEPGSEFCQHKIKIAALKQER